MYDSVDKLQAHFLRKSQNTFQIHFCYRKILFVQILFSQLTKPPRSEGKMNLDANIQGRLVPVSALLDSAKENSEVLVSEGSVCKLPNLDTEVVTREKKEYRAPT